ncbi:MAG: helix-hairpin-helix domain-containing protein [Blautia sp.]|nr:helix-hairpin-helix domain-containing protein [Blautia sp.]MDY3999049.1 helix-hairpin-helix domain-containing protein [Blautia sp.]
MRNGELAAIKGRGVNRRTMKLRIKMIYRIFRWFLSGMIWCLVVFAAAGCGGRDTRFLENTGYRTEEENTSDQTTESEEEESVLESELNNSASNQTGSEESEQEPDSSTENEKTIYVDVCGAVKNPGVYELEAGARIFQAIDAAGGLLPEAAAEYVNRAGFLGDGQQIYIPTRQEAETDSSLKGPSEQMDEAGDAAGSTNEKVNLNTADEAALTALTGIGASKAQAILAYREEHGGFSAIEEILNVPGIKEGTFAKIKDNISVE